MGLQSHMCRAHVSTKKRSHAVSTLSFWTYMLCSNIVLYYQCFSCRDRKLCWKRVAGSDLINNEICWTQRRAGHNIFPLLCDASVPASRECGCTEKPFTVSFLMSSCAKMHNTLTECIGEFKWFFFVCFFLSHVLPSVRFQIKSGNLKKMIFKNTQNFRCICGQEKCNTESLTVLSGYVLWGCEGTWREVPFHPREH